MYFIKGFIIILLNACPSSWSTDDYNLLLSSKVFPQRLLQLMDNYVARAKARMDEVLYIRSYYEISPHFEYGYVLCEIMERYRKMVGTIQRPLVFKSDAVFDTIKRTELVQKLFFDVLHLVYMAHEIQRKYSHMPEFQYDREDINISMAVIEESKKYRLWLKKKHQKEMKKEREWLEKGIMRTHPRVSRRPNKWWPVDYGWEIDHQFW